MFPNHPNMTCNMLDFVHSIFSSVEAQFLHARCLFFFFLKNNSIVIFRGVLGSQQTQSRRYISYISCSSTCVESLIINISQQNGPFVIIGGPTVTHFYAMSIVYIRVHSWFGTLYGFGEICEYVYSPLQYHTEGVRVVAQWKQI